MLNDISYTVLLQPHYQDTMPIFLNFHQVCMYTKCIRPNHRMYLSRSDFRSHSQKVRQYSDLNHTFPKPVHVDPLDRYSVGFLRDASVHRDVVYTRANRGEKGKGEGFVEQDFYAVIFV